MNDLESEPPSPDSPVSPRGDSVWLSEASEVKMAGLGVRRRGERLPGQPDNGEASRLELG